MPERNALVKAYEGKPVKFIAVGANMSPIDALVYQRSNKLAMPIFADNLGLMQARYGFTISLQNIWQYRIIDPQGRLLASNLTKESIDQVVAATNPESKFGSLELDPKLAPLVEPFEYNQLVLGMKQMAAVKKTAKKADLAQLAKLQDAVKEDATKLKTEAEAEQSTDPVAAYDLYAKLSTAFPNDELGKSSQKAMKTLSTEKQVKSELAARTAYNKISTGLSSATPAQRPIAAKMLEDFAKKHADTPTGAKAKALAEEISSLKAPPAN